MTAELWVFRAGDRVRRRWTDLTGEVTRVTDRVVYVRWDRPAMALHELGPLADVQNLDDLTPEGGMMRNV